MAGVTRTEAAEALWELATGGQPPVPVTVLDKVDPFEHPEAQRRFRIMTDASKGKQGREQRIRGEMGWNW